MQARLQKPYNDGSCHFNYFKVGFFISDLFGRRLWRRRPTWRQSSLSSHLICSRWIVPHWFEFGMCQIFVLCFDMRCCHIRCCSHRVFSKCSSLTCSNRLLESNRNICHLPCIPAQNEHHMLSNKASMKQRQDYPAQQSNITYRLTHGHS